MYRVRSNSSSKNISNSKPAAEAVKSNGIRKSATGAAGANGLNRSSDGYASRKPVPSPTSITTTLRRTGLSDNTKKPKPGNSSRITTGVFKPAPPVGAAPGSRTRESKNRHHLDLRLNKTPPLSPSRMVEEQHQSSASTSCISFEPDTPPVEGFTPVCKEPQSHPGSSTLLQSPVNEFFIQRTWIKGPADPSGTVVGLSDRPSLCMSVYGSELAVGSSDHAVYTIDVQTCIDHLPDGRIISGGMDSKLCLWDKRGVRSRDLKGHTASVSGVKAGCFNQGTVAVSSSYDRSLILWDVGGAAGKEIGKLVGHKAPVMEFASTPRGRLVSGCRDGNVILWDVSTKSPVLQCKGAHKGHVTALKSFKSGTSGVKSRSTPFLSTGMFGDRSDQEDNLRLSTDNHGRGRQNSEGVGCASVVQRCSQLGGSQRLHLQPETGSLVWSGGGDGSLLVHDAERGKCLYGLGAIKNGAVRGISLAGETQEKLVVTGDDGNVMIYSL